MPSATPILDLEAPRPVSKANVSISLKGLATAVPAALGLLALFVVLLAVLFKDDSFVAWMANTSGLVGQALETLFEFGPLVAIPLMLFGTFLVTVVHEAGHAAAARLYKWPISEFRVVPLTLQRVEEGWKLRVSWKLSPGGLVVAHPPTSARFHSKIRVYALAGPITNLGVAIIVLLISIPPVTMFSALSTFFAGWSLIMGLLNLLPIHIQNLELDGYVAFMVSRNSRRLSQRLAGLKMRSHSLSGKPLTSMNQRWVALAASGRMSLQNRLGLWLAYEYWFLHGQLDRAAVILEGMLQKSGEVDEGFKALLFAECAVFGAVRGQKAIAHTWRDRASEFFLPDYLRRRCNSYVAWVQQDFEDAHREAVLGRDAILKLEENSQQALLPNWNLWIEALDQARVAKTEEVEKSQSAGLLQNT